MWKLQTPWQHALSGGFSARTLASVCDEMFPSAGARQNPGNGIGSVPFDPYGTALPAPAKHAPHGTPRSAREASCSAALAP